MRDWRFTTLGQFVSLQRGHDLPTDQRSEGDVPVMGSFGITGWHNVARANGPGVTVGRSGASIGVVSYIDRAYWPLNTCLFATEFHGNSPRFVYYFLKMLDLAAHNSGSAQPSLNRNYIAPIKIKVPDRPEQDDIVNLLGSLDDKIELNRRMNETLEAMAQAIFRDWFIDYGPTRRKMDGATDAIEIMGGLVSDPDRARELAALFPGSLGDEGRPKGWKEKRLDEIGSQHTASLTPLSYPEERFDHYSIPAFDKERSPTTELGAAILSNKTLVPSNAVLLSKLNPEIARVWLSNNSARHRKICSTEFLAYTPNEPFGRALLYALFTSDPFRTLLCGMVTGTSKSHQRVSSKALAQREVLTLGLAEAAQFETIVCPLLDRVQHNRGENRTLAATRDLLLPKLMSGEIRLRDAERAIEAVA